MYKPHVMGIMVGQTYRILNSDGVLHNIHTLPKVNPAFNKGMPATLKETTTVFAKPEAVFHIKCDVHPWMSAYVGVFEHPYFAVTKEDGSYSIKADGTYPFMAFLEIEFRNGSVSRCGGTLIARDSVLTAAHCVRNARRVLLTVGRTVISQSQGQLRSVRYAFTHPRYNPRSLRTMQRS